MEGLERKLQMTLQLPRDVMVAIAEEKEDTMTAKQKIVEKALRKHLQHRLSKEHEHGK